MLAPFLERMEAGQIVDTKEILAAYEKALGRSAEKDHGRIYRVLARHGWRKAMPRSVHPDKVRRKKLTSLKIKSFVQELRFHNLNRHARLMFQDEAGFGRINKPKYCWCVKGLRPVVPCRHIRGYRYCFGAVDPISGESFFLIMPRRNTEMMNLYLEELSKRFPDDIIVLVCGGAGWHRSGDFEIPESVRIFHLPPSTPEMNPIEQIWKELRARGFRNEIFETLSKVEDRLCEVIHNLKKSTVRSITARQWGLDCF